MFSFLRELVFPLFIVNLLCSYRRWDCNRRWCHKMSCGTASWIQKVSSIFWKWLSGIKFPSNNRKSSCKGVFRDIWIFKRNSATIVHVFLFLFVKCLKVWYSILNQAALEHRMGPRGSALICGYTFHHRLLESCLAKLKKKEVCIECYIVCML